MTNLAELIAAAAHECDDPECPCDPDTTIYTSASTGGMVTLVEGPPETIAAVVQPELDQRDEKIAKLRALWTAVAKTSQERKAEADGRRQYGEELKTENEQLRERAESAERMAATAMETVGRLQREERTTEQLRAQQEARAEQAEAERDRLDVRMDEIVEGFKNAHRYHRADQSGTLCATCHTRYPCPTARALDAIGDQASDVVAERDQLKAAIARVKALAEAARGTCGKVCTCPTCETEDWNAEYEPHPPTWTGWSLNPADVLAALDQPADSKEG